MSLLDGPWGVEWVECFLDDCGEDHWEREGHGHRKWHRHHRHRRHKATITLGVPTMPVDN